jgi:osmoprotectant transport system ATP-binding protein
MSAGKLLQYDRPAALVTDPADPFVSRLTGAGDRALRLLSLISAGAVAVAGEARGTPLAASLSLRDALSELMWRGVEGAPVINADGTPAGVITIASIVAHGRPG